MLHKPPSKNLRVGRVWSKTKSNCWMVLCLASPQHMLNSIVQKLSNCRQLQQLCCTCWDHQCLRISPVSWCHITCMMILIVSRYLWYNNSQYWPRNKPKRTSLSEPYLATCGILALVIIQLNWVPGVVFNYTTFEPKFACFEDRIDQPTRVPVRLIS